MTPDNEISNHVSPPRSGSVVAYHADTRWEPGRPKVLVVACSDGRLQLAVDEFLHNHLAIDDYDRYYIPGGPGGIATGGAFEFSRADYMRKDSAFLLRAHEVRELILLFHGSADDDPEHDCADYKRKLDGWSSERILQQQLADVHEIIDHVAELPWKLNIRAYRAEVDADHSVRFVDLLG